MCEAEEPQMPAPVYRDFRTDIVALKVDQKIADLIPALQALADLLRATVSETPPTPREGEST